MKPQTLFGKILVTSYLTSTAIALPDIANAQGTAQTNLLPSFEFIIPPPQQQPATVGAMAAPPTDISMYDMEIEGTGTNPPANYEDLSFSEAQQIFSQTQSPISLPEKDQAQTMSFAPGSFDARAGQRTFYRRHIGQWVDLLSWQIRTECVKWAWGKWPWGGGWKTCVGHKYQRRHIIRDVYVSVRMSTPSDIDNIASSCIRTASIATVLESVGKVLLTGGTSSFSEAFRDFPTAFKECIEYKLKTPVLSVNIEPVTRGWGNWI